MATKSFYGHDKEEAEREATEWLTANHQSVTILKKLSVPTLKPPIGNEFRRPLSGTAWEVEIWYTEKIPLRDDVLTPAQVVAIRQLAAEGKDERLIFEIVGARNVDQVKRVLTGKFRAAGTAGTASDGTG